MTTDLVERPHRAPAQFEHPDVPETNVGDVERWISAGAGAALIGFGLARLFSKRPHLFSGLAGTALGALLVDRGARGHCMVYSALGVNANDPTEARDHITIQKTITVRQPAEVLYAFWRRIENMPFVMSHVASVDVIDDRRSRWVADLHVGPKLSWETEIITDIPGEMIAWRSLPGSMLPQEGSVRFENVPARGTEVRVELSFRVPAGSIGVAVGKLLDDVAAKLLRDDLRRFKTLMETGEIPTTIGQPVGASKKKTNLVEVSR